MDFNAYDFTYDPDVQGTDTEKREEITYEWHCSLIREHRKALFERRSNNNIIIFHKQTCKVSSGTQTQVLLRHVYMPRLKLSKANMTKHNTQFD